uniref:metallophosphoesterase n=1 Tax=Roseateles sp. TaxID=1971397 RepID=UPI0031DBEE17
MRTRTMRALAALGLVAASALSVVSMPLSAAELKLRVLETSDIHMNLLSYDYYQDRPVQEFGLARTITLIHRARAEAPNSLLFDNGDLLQGNPLGDVVARVRPLAADQVHPAYKILNLLDVDAANLGNHEFNYGLPFLRQAIAGAAFPYLNANVMEADGRRHAFTPSVMLEREMRDEAGQAHALKIGVVGVTPPQILEWDRQHLAGKVRVRDMVEAATEQVTALRRRGADLVVVIAHTGIDRTELPRLSENMAAQLARVKGVDVLLLGHAHTEFPGPGFAGYPGVDLAKGRLYGTPAVMPGRWGDHLGVVDLTLQSTGQAAAGARWRVADSQSSLRPIFDRAARRTLADADPMPAVVIAQEHQATLDYVRSQVAVADQPIHSYFSQVLDGNAVRLVAQAQLAYARKAVQGTALSIGS